MLALLLTLLVACGGPSTDAPVPVGPAQADLTRLDAVVVAVNRTRAALLEAAGVVPAAATALDAADQACLTGSTALAGEARRPARAAAAQIPAALTTLAEQVVAYLAALRELEQAAASLDPAQRDVLTQAAVAGEQEATALAGFGEAAQEAWPAYAALDEVQSTWLDRASAGWYRTAAEAAGGYVVLRRPQLAELEQARTALQQADAARRPPTERVRAALQRADAALEGLRAPSG